jgi:hypothetical protein
VTTVLPVIIDLIEHGVAVFSQTAPLSTGVFGGVFHNYPANAAAAPAGY